MGSQGSKEKNEQKLNEFVKDLEPIWVQAFGTEYTFKKELMNKVNICGGQYKMQSPAVAAALTQRP